VTDEYLADRFKWRYLNAPFYVVAIAVVLYVVSGFFLPASIDGVRSFSLTQLAIGLTAGTLLGVFSTLAFAIAESRFPTAAEAAQG
jgi:putative membrane protein